MSDDRQSGQPESGPLLSYPTNDQQVLASIEDKLDRLIKLVEQIALGLGVVT